MFEAFECVLFKIILNEVLPNLSDEIHDLASEESDIILLEYMKCVKPFRLKFDKCMQKVRDRYPGKSPVFDNLHQYHA